LLLELCATSVMLCCGIWSFLLPPESCQTSISSFMTAVVVSSKEPAQEVPQPAAGMDPAYYALNLLRRRKLDRCIEASTEVLTKNPFDQQVWYIKTRALTLKSWMDDTEMEEEGVAELLLDESGASSAPRPGTSIQRAQSSAKGSTMVAGGVAAGRPMSTSGRPLSGIARPGTNNRSAAHGGGVEGAFLGNRPGTTRPVTTSGRFVRLGTASMVSQADSGGPFIDATRMDFKKYSQRPSLAKALCDYILYVDHNPRRALELCNECTQAAGFADWWWKARLGKCYYQLGLFRDAEKQFKSSIKHQENISVLLELGKVYQKLDQPLSALELFEKAFERNPRDHHLLINTARIYDLLNDSTKAVTFYKKVLTLDGSSVEAIACIAASTFYEDQPEIALRMYRRLLQMGINTTELWNNLGLCCFYASQYDMALSCFERAMLLADDDNGADVWYNIGQVAIGIGDVGLAYQAFRVATSLDPNHAEAFNNLGILELRKGNVDASRNSFSASSSLSNFIHEPLFNKALLHFKMGEFQDSYLCVAKALEAYPDHPESLELRRQLRQTFTAL
jgi:tetratricopeptide repeat protein 8